MTDTERETTSGANGAGARLPTDRRANIGEYLLAMSHEIRAPLNAVIGMSGMLLDGDLGDKNRQYAKSVHSAGESLAAILNDLLDLSRVTAGRLVVEPIPFDLKSTIEETASVLSPRANERGLALRVDWRPELPRHVIGDPGRTRQVLGNLIGHAVNATSQGEVIIRVMPDGERDGVPAVRFVVEDTGIGIMPERLAHIFDDYVPVDASPYRSFGVTGLGLRLSADLVRRMGGEIGAASEAGKGSRFWFVLPMPNAEPAVITPVGQPQRGGRALVVEADASARGRYVDQIEEASWDVEFTDNFAGVIETLRAAASIGDPFDACFISDYAVRPLHIELAVKVKAQAELAKTALIMVTAVGSPGEGKKLWHAGFAAYLRKPVPHEEMRDTLAALSEIGPEGRGPALITRHSLAESRNAQAFAPDGIDEMLASLKPSEETTAETPSEPTPAVEPVVAAAPPPAEPVASEPPVPVIRPVVNYLPLFAAAPRPALPAGPAAAAADQLTALLELPPVQAALDAAPIAASKVELAAMESAAPAPEPVIELAAPATEPVVELAAPPAVEPVIEIPAPIVGESVIEPMAPTVAVSLVEPAKPNVAESVLELPAPAVAESGLELAPTPVEPPFELTIPTTQPVIEVEPPAPAEPVVEAAAPRLPELPLTWDRPEEFDPSSVEALPAEGLETPESLASNFAHLDGLQGHDFGAGDADAIIEPIEAVPPGAVVEPAPILAKLRPEQEHHAEPIADAASIEDAPAATHPEISIELSAPDLPVPADVTAEPEPSVIEPAAPAISLSIGEVPVSEPVAEVPIVVAQVAPTPTPGATPAPEEPDLFEPEKLEVVGPMIVDQLAHGGGFFTQYLVTSFVREVPAAIAELATASNRGDGARIKQALTTLKTVAGSVGAERMIGFCERAERAVDRDRLDEGTSLIGSIEQAFVAARDALDLAAPTGLPADIPAVGAAFLDQVGPDREGPAKALAVRLIDSFSNDASAKILELREAVARGDADAAQRLAQTVKGMCGLISAEPLAKLCALVEADARLKRIGQAGRYLDHLDREFERIRQVLAAAQA